MLRPDKEIEINIYASEKLQTREEISWAVEVCASNPFREEKASKVACGEIGFGWE